MSRSRWIRAAGSLAFVGLGACAADAGSGALPLASVEVDVALLDEALLERAVDGCEGLLAGDERFGIDRDRLMVAVRGETPVCRDTSAAIAEELHAIGVIDVEAFVASQLEEAPVPVLLSGGDGDPVGDGQDPEMTSSDLARTDGPRVGEPTFAAGDPSPEPGAIVGLGASELVEKHPRPRMPWER
jgi:hypothetical protein